MKTKAISKRNSNVELLRFLFCWSIVFYHAKFPKYVFGGGYLGVEFFFIITGIYLGKKLKRESEHAESLRETLAGSWNYLWRRIQSIYPFYILSCAVGMFVCVAAVLVSADKISEIAATLSDLLLCLPGTLLFWQNYGLPAQLFNVVTWYLCAMFFALWILYPLMRRHYCFFIKYIAPVGVLCVTGILLHTYGRLDVEDVYLFELINTGFLRAISMISLGAIINETAEYMKSKILENSIRLAVIEIMAYLMVFLYMAVGISVWGGKSSYDGSILFFMTLAVTITVSERSILNGLIPNKLGIILGRFSMVMFLNHFYWLNYLPKIFAAVKVPIGEMNCKWIAIVISVLTSGLVYILGNQIQKKVKKKGMLQT